MKKRHLMIGLLLSVSILGAGCKKTEMPVVYNNLADSTVRYDLDSLLETAGVGDASRAQFFSHVDQFNDLMKQEELAEDFEPLANAKYDPYEVQDRWMEAYPYFMGYNCRITSYSLFGEKFLNQPEEKKSTDTEMLEFDLDALHTDPSAFPGREEKFADFFAIVPTEPSKDVKIHAENVRDAWKKREISFIENENIRMVNVYFHVQDGERNFLYVGHSGILLPTPDGTLWFLEKLAFQEPYQVTVFQNRKQLSDYLMEKYDLDQGQPTAKPFIMENDNLMKI